MFTTTSIYFLLLFLMLWCYCGYLIFLIILAKLQPSDKKKPTSLTHFPKISIFVPCFNEQSFIQQKIDNLKSLKYAYDRLDVYFLHGQSTDKTGGIIEDAIRETDNDQGKYSDLDIMQAIDFVGFNFFRDDWEEFKKVESPRELSLEDYTKSGSKKLIN